MLFFFLAYVLFSAAYFFMVVFFQGKHFDKKEPAPASIVPFLEPNTIRNELRKQELRQAV